MFSDDWGRHPSSCQHLVRRLVDRYPTLWVNTIGTRLPGLNADDLKKVAEKLRQWCSSAGKQNGIDLPEKLDVISPRMYPGFRTDWQRRFNARRITGAVHRAIGPRADHERRIVISTLPMTADLIRENEGERIGKLDVDQWVYYCVDDFSVWPGLDGPVMEEMERLQAARVDKAIAVSPTLQDRLSGMGCESTLITHGIDLEHWTDSVDPAMPGWGRELPEPIVLFWGLVDQRLDTSVCQALVDDESFTGTLILVGPQQSPDSALSESSRIVMPGPMPYDDLPALAAAADVLVMPYADLPVTRAMQPLKFKEYLATGKPVVARSLPSNQQWSSAADLVTDARGFVSAVQIRLEQGITAEQRNQRQRLADETWEAKAAAFADSIGLS